MGLTIMNLKFEWGRDLSIFNKESGIRVTGLTKQTKNKNGTEICLFLTRKVLFGSLGLDYERVWNLSKKACKS